MPPATTIFFLAIMAAAEGGGVVAWAGIVDAVSRSSRDAGIVEALRFEILVADPCGLGSAMQ